MKAKSTEHDWADWLWIMEQDNVPLSLEAVTEYRTELANVGGEKVKGMRRLDARREELRLVECARKQDTKKQRFVEDELKSTATIRKALSNRIANIEWDGDSEEHTTGLDLLVLQDGKPAGMLGADESERRRIVGKQGLRS